MILHITNDYSGSTVYKNLVEELDNLGLSQIVYNPVKEKSRIGKNKIGLEVSDSDIIYSHILNKTTDRVFYRKKIKKILKDIETKIDFSEIKMIHAHTLYSDGGVAYELSKKYNIPYIVTIRNTDLNLFQKKLKYIRPYGKRILDKAQKVILISASYKDRILSQKSLQSILPHIKEKIKIIPNGVDPFWIDNLKIKTLNQKKLYNILYIGNFNPGKNVLNLISAVKNINKHEKICTLQLVGGGGADEIEVVKQIKQLPELFTFHGKIYDKDTLKSIFQSSDIFAMPSRNETFGLVYVEAMLQGLPILYTANEGIDGFYQENIGEKVSKQAGASEIKQAILKLIDDYDNYEIPTQKLLNKHDWKKIAKKYLLLYNKNNNSNL